MLSQKGFTPIVIAVAVVILLALAGGGYMVMQKNGSAPTMPGVGSMMKSLNPVCKFNDPELCKFFNNWKDMKQYSVTSTTSSKSGPSGQVSFELSGENFHMMMSEAGKESYNVITMGDTTYTKDYSDNKWWKQKQPKQKDDLKNKFEFNINDDNSNDTKTEDKTTYKSMGKEACSSMQCFKYQVVSPDTSDTTEYIWFDDKEYLLRKEEMQSKDGSTVSEFSYSGVNIQTPSPTKEASPNQVIMPGGGMMQNQPQVSDDAQKKIEDVLKSEKDKANQMMQVQDSEPDPVNPDGN